MRPLSYSQDCIHLRQERKRYKLQTITGHHIISRYFGSGSSGTTFAGGSWSEGEKAGGRQIAANKHVVKLMRKTGYLQMGMLTLGLGFAEAASRSVHAPRWQQRLSLVGYYLYCHSIERALKSHLKESGFSDQQLRDIGPELQKVFDEAVEKIAGDEALAPELLETMGMLNAYYRGDEVDYFSRVMKTRLPDTRQFSSAVMHLRRSFAARYSSDSDKNVT